MTAIALKALKESIAHWRRLATGRRKGGEWPVESCCALCKQFINRALLRWGVMIRLLYWLNVAVWGALALHALIGGML